MLILRHGGSGAAIFAAKHMVTFIERTPQWKAYLRDGATNVQLLGEALIQAFDDIDASLRIEQENDNSSQPDTSGCTSNTAMITPHSIVCANAGDSRCVLGTNKVAKGLSEDHKPYDENERRRIEAAGGTVQWKRVDGDLAVSRALGDFQYKTRKDLPPTQQKVTFLPDITIHTRTPEDDVLLLACDGLWDVMSNNEAIDLVRKIYQTGEPLAQNMAEEMVDIALEKGMIPVIIVILLFDFITYIMGNMLGSRDNISAIVVQLPGAVIGPSENGGVTRLREMRSAGRDNVLSSGQESHTG